MTPLLSRRAFSAIELLLAAPVAAVLACGMIYLLACHAVTAARIDDRAAARARADRVCAILREPLALAGYGMPRDEAEYRQTFPTSGVEDNTFYTWPGPVSIAHSTVDWEERPRGACRIVYAIPSRVMTAEASAASGDRVALELTGNPAALEIVKTAYSPISVKNWAVFGAMRPAPRPMWFAARGGAHKIVLRRTAAASGDAAATIPAGDELYYLRATTARAGLYGRGDWAFFTDHRDGSGRQPRVIGVVDARFELALPARILKMHLLIRGDRRHAGKITEGTPDGWPEEYAGDIPDTARHYRLYAFETTFGLRNF